jgi:hypothetical protein
MHKGLVGFAKYSLLVSILAAVVFGLALNTGVVSADHTATVTIDPNIANCDESGFTFTVNVKNDGSSIDDIFEVRIYDDSYTETYGILEFYCGPAPTGWQLYNHAIKGSPDYYGYCEYKTQQFGSYVIEPREDVNFTFDATIFQEACYSKFLVSTLDNKVPTGQHQYYTPEVKIDCTPPIIEKSLKYGTGIGVCPPSLQMPSDECWIKQSTCVYFDGHDNITCEEDDNCNLGLDYCEYSYTVDGVQHESGIVDPVNDHATKEICFDEDSLHELTITCYDVAGNVKTDIEKFRVDDTPPVTTKVVSEPKKIDPSTLTEWIDTATTITLNAVDPDPTTHNCNISVEETWYKNVLLSDNWSPCLEPYMYCKLEYFPTQFDENTWTLYDGTPIQKDQESCHILYYFSVDQLGNVEDMKMNCFFVDKTPPIPSKEIGDPQYGGCPEEGIGNTVQCIGFTDCQVIEGKKDFFTTGRADPTNWDLAIWKDAESTPRVQNEYAWINGGGDEVPFSVSYDPDTGLVTYTVDQTTLTWTYDSGKAFEYLVIMGKGKWSGDAKCDMSLEDIEVNGVGVGDIITEGNYKGLRVYLSDGQQTNGFTVTGYAAMNWASGCKKQEIPAFHVFAMGTHDPEDCWLRDDNSLPGTPITLDCVDPYPHPSGDEEVCYKISFDLDPDGYITDTYCLKYGGYMEDGWCCADVSDSMPMVEALTVLPQKKYTIRFTEDSLHDLEYFCRDAVDKKSAIDLEWFRVDSQPPIIEKDMIGSYLGDCPSGTDIEHGDCYVADDDSSGVAITAYDDEKYGCAVGVDIDKCRYGLWWHTTEQECYDAGYTHYDPINGRCDVTEEDNTIPGYREILFQEDSTHDLVIYCYDKLENLFQHEETFLVDSTPPVTTKTYGIPFKEKDGKHWITSATPITLKATDAKVGVDYIKYRYCLDAGCYEDCGPCDCGDKASWETVYDDEVTFTILEDSEHCIEFYAVDKLGNEETIKQQCVYVDNKPPQTTKEIGSPKVEKDGKIYITKDTEIKLTCNDQDPHPVDHSAIKYRYRFAETCEGLASATWTDWLDPNGADPVVKIIKFTEDSCHELEYYCTDALGNTETVHSEIDIVDTKPPVITKEVIGPQLECPPVVVGEPMPCDGWACLDGLTKDFFTTGRYGNQITPAQTWELAIWEYTGGSPPEVVRDQDEYIWTNGEEVHFSVNYDAESGEITYILGDKTLQYTYEIGKAFEYIIPFAKGDGSGNNVELTDLELNGVSLPDVLSNNAYKGLKVPLSDADQTEGFFLEGNAKLIWGGSPANEKPAFHIFAMNTHDPVEDCHMIDGVTEIHVDADDPEPHPVDDVMCAWRYIVTDGEGMGGAQEVTPPFVIQFPEESTHILYITCWDKLGNTVTDVEKFIVDKTPPVTTKTYGTPFYTDGTSKWITSDTEITLTVDDAGPHKSGIDATYYRVTRLGAGDENNAPCLDNSVCQQQTGTGDFLSYTTAFKIGQESCHLIEYYSVDKVEKTETVKKQCVFVDNSAPTPDKTVEEPKTPWEPTEYGVDVFFYPDLVDKCWKDEAGEGMSSEDCKADPFCIECWKVTMNTQITLDCNDPAPHPVDHEKVCFKVELDGIDATEDYCEEYCNNFDFAMINGDGKPPIECMEGDYCCVEGPVDFSFHEETEHNLDFYCIDALGNYNDVHDDEKFKVEGTAFEIPLYFKWNLISVPFVLLNDAPKEVFKDTPGVEAVWAYDGETGDWLVYTSNETIGDTLNEIEPGWGYWVMEKIPDDGLIKPSEWLVIGGSLFSPATVPPSRDLVKGWNLIGYYGSRWQLYKWSDENFMCGDAMNCWDRNVFGDKVYCALNSLVDTQQGFPKWSAVWSYLNCGDYETYWFGLNTCPEDGFQEFMSRMYAGRGYWLELDEDDLYAPATTCIWNEDWECVSNFAGGMY